MELAKELFNNFFTSSLVTKLLIFLSAFFAPIWELYILLLFLTSIDYCMDLFVWFFNRCKTCKHWQITQPFIIKLILYSVLVIVVQAVQNHLIKNDFQIFRLIIAIPIISETMGIIATVERYTGVKILDKARGYLDNWLSSKQPKKDE
ncbi:hypothetical protein [Sphingobacterium sp.]|uniref:hypothetical protein n=1 Tax=Sphingobacterium sp. TaxID=341027 RepID=UPI0028A882AB|nr:hypothetical protein [Sphingobacterium sp.]